MKLTKIKIENYRSIKQLDFDFQKNNGKDCHILIGINETGKSNILKAMNFLDKSIQINYQHDCNRQALTTGEAVKVTYFFDKIDNNEIVNLLTDSIHKRILSELIFEMISKEISYNDKSSRQEKYILKIKQSSIEKIRKNEELWKQISDKIQEFTTDDETILEEYLIRNISTHLDKLLPKVIFWKYAPQYLISEAINLNIFKSNPDGTSIPLRNILLLKGVPKENFGKYIDQIIQSTQLREQAETELSRISTTHLNKLWPEHKIGLRVRIERDGLCEVSVYDLDNDSERFRMDQRSDGFKQFVSILLTLSAEHAIGTLKDNIILLDEPENSLHPGSVKFLRDALLEISRNNHIVLATHSIFMIDKTCLKRHLTVNKYQNKTKVSQVNNAFDDEIVYNALGTSIFEIIRSNMIIFEGEHDKEVFDFFREKLNSEDGNSSFGTIEASGANKIELIFKFFKNTRVKGFVVVDSDDKGRSIKRALQQKFRQDREFILELKDLVSLGKTEATLEDLMPEGLLNETVLELFNISLASSTEAVIKRLKQGAHIRNDSDKSYLKKAIVDKIRLDLRNLPIEKINQKYSIYLGFFRNLLRKITGTSSSTQISKELLEVEESLVGGK